MARHDRNPRGGVPRQAGKHDKGRAQQRKMAQRERDNRRKAALAEAADERRKLEARLAREAEQPVEGETLGAAWAKANAMLLVEPEPPPELPAQKPAVRRRKPLPVPPEAEGTDWPMGQARSLVRAGYNVIHVMAYTGWGLNALDDLAIDCDGYGIRFE